MASNYLHPRSLLRYVKTLVPWSLGIALIFGIVGLAVGLVFSPADYQQGEIVRIMYIHVPASWGALGAYTAMAIFSGWGMITRTPVMHLFTKSPSAWLLH
jgi:heme exporter protein C